MAFNFPDAPTIGDGYGAYTWDGEKWNLTPVGTPTITSAAAVSVNENATLAHTLTANEVVTWANVGGADTGMVEIASGNIVRWTGDTTRNFESPADANTDNVYLITIRATDTDGNPRTQNLSITVLDVGDETAPVVTTPPTVAGAATEGATLTGTNGTYSGSTPITFEYRWLRATVAGGLGTIISGPTAASYITVTADIGFWIFRDERATNAFGNSGWISSSNDIGPITSAAAGDVLLLADGVSRLLLANGIDRLLLAGTTVAGPTETLTDESGETLTDEAGNPLLAG